MGWSQWTGSLMSSAGLSCKLQQGHVMEPAIVKVEWKCLSRWNIWTFLGFHQQVSQLIGLSESQPQCLTAQGVVVSDVNPSSSQCISAEVLVMMSVY